MDLVDVLKIQKKKGGSLVAFNVQNIEHLDILSQVIKILNKPAIAQFSARYINFWESKIGINNLINKYQNNGLFFFLDHCNDTELINFCISTGFAGVMYDGSHNEIHENINESNKLFKSIKKSGRNTILEVEIGTIKGVEDGFYGSDIADYFSMSDLNKFAELGRFDLMALAIGNAHGQYKTVTEIRPKLLKEAISAYPDLKLVLHGGTGMPVSMVQECIKYGVVKINVSTELKLETQNALKAYSQKSHFNHNEFYNEISDSIIPFFTKLINQYTA